MTPVPPPMGAPRNTQVELHSQGKHAQSTASVCIHLFLSAMVLWYLCPQCSCQKEFLHDLSQISSPRFCYAPVILKSLQCLMYKLTASMHCRQGMQEYHMHNAFGALTSLANLQAIAAMQGAANLSGAGASAALGGNLDFMGSMNRHASLGGLGGLGITNSEPAAPVCSVFYIALGECFLCSP